MATNLDNHVINNMLIKVIQILNCMVGGNSTCMPTEEVYVCGN